MDFLNKKNCEIHVQQAKKEWSLSYSQLVGKVLAKFLQIKILSIKSDKKKKETNIKVHDFVQFSAYFI